MKPTLIVLAAGMGSRYGGVKQIDPIGPSGEAIIDYSIYDAIRAGFENVIFIIRPEIENDVKEFFAGKFETKINLTYAIQSLDDLPGDFTVPVDREKPWGTAHAILAARDLVASPFAVINADDFYGQHAFEATYGHLVGLGEVSDICALIGYRMDATLSENGSVSRGVVSHDNENWLTDVEEHTRIERTPSGIVSYDDDGNERSRFTGSELVSMNLWGFAPNAMDTMWRQFTEFISSRGNEPKSEFYIPYAVNDMVNQGEARCKVISTTSTWFGVTYPQDRESAVASMQKLVDSKEYPESLWG